MPIVDSSVVGKLFARRPPTERRVRCMRRKERQVERGKRDVPWPEHRHYRTEYIRLQDPCFEQHSTRLWALGVSRYSGRGGVKGRAVYTPQMTRSPRKWILEGSTSDTSSDSFYDFYKIRDWKSCSGGEASFFFSQAALARRRGRDEVQQHGGSDVNRTR
jgi:hypothetical protein